jgi:2-oxoglutarate ferredoxin oxidoreductase subunit beta
MEETLKRAAVHKGAAFVEILQNCNVYNDMAWSVLYDRESKVLHELRLQHGKPLVWGPLDDRRGLVLEGVKPKVVKVADVAESALWVHDETDGGTALVLAQLWSPEYPIPLGVLANKAGESTYEEIPDPAGAEGHLGARPRRHRQLPVGRYLEDRLSLRVRRAARRSPALPGRAGGILSA